MSVHVCGRLRREGRREVNTGYRVFPGPRLCVQIEACSVERALLPSSEAETGYFFLSLFFLFGSLTHFASGLMSNPNRALGHFENMSITLWQNTTRRTAILLLLKPKREPTHTADSLESKWYIVTLLSKTTHPWSTLQET